MYKDKKIAVVVPAYNEEKLISFVIQGMPVYVDCIYAIDDGSTDRTQKIIQTLAADNPRLKIIIHPQNFGVGAAVFSGYQQALADGVDVAVVMAGDNQMEHRHLPLLLDPLIENKADYAKGDRLSIKDYSMGMNKWRRFGNYMLTWLTRLAASNFSINDPQNGYTAINRRGLELLTKKGFYTGYGYCNDVLVKLSSFSLKIIEIPIPARYGSEESKIRYHSYIPKVSWLLLNLYLWRLKNGINLAE